MNHKRASLTEGVGKIFRCNPWTVGWAEQMPVRQTNKQTNNKETDRQTDKICYLCWLAWFSISDVTTTDIKHWSIIAKFFAHNIIVNDFSLTYSKEKNVI
jgi:hypothetical protein